MERIKIYFPGFFGGFILLVVWALIGLSASPSPTPVVANFGQGAIFIALPALLGTWGVWRSIKKPVLGGFVQVLLGLPGAYFWSQAQLYIIFEKKDGLLEASLATLGATLFLVSGFLSLRRNRNRVE
ncbi:MAG: hypothetical protein HXX08_18890 [Chloroflexi bacterium]|uniref:Uncharacterized protein n=1 Tax=Candidatus Chlorohelix allophototropha TaxID=3003348 RepID=A0A8T7M6Z9_9CHLR|nr:hypothetical protein [Chloroflexota bacterium]WJW69829.1 hypothetical protein OZ401_003459 [Chloroflexota bacterium L227-S17]